MPLKRSSSTTTVTTTTKPVKKARFVSRRVVTPEFKHAHRSLTAAISGVNPYCVNLNYFLSEGVKRYNVLSTGLDLRSITMRFYLAKIYTAGSSFNGGVVRLMVVKSRLSYTNTQAVITASEIFRNDGTASASHFGTTSHPDYDKVKVLSDRTIKFDAQSVATNNTAGHCQLNWKIPIKRKEKTTADNTGVFRDGQYYLIISPFAYGDDKTQNAWDFLAQWSLDYYDA